MKYIDKKASPDFFGQYIEKEKPVQWATLSKDIGTQLREYMLQNEQSSQCAYTEIHISTIGDAHIDHFRKRSIFPTEIFTYENLYTACNNEDFGAKYKDRHIKETDYSIILHPLSDELLSAFSYNLASGEIKGRNEKAIKTIELFNLNHKILKERRKETILNLKMYQSHFSLSEIMTYIPDFHSLLSHLYSTI